MAIPWDRFYGGDAGSLPSTSKHVQQGLGLYERFDLVHPGNRILEIGTGWMHWEATVLRLFHDVQITLFDVWDNRQFGAYQCYCRQLLPILDRLPDVPALRRAQAVERLQKVLKTRCFEEVYDLLTFRYVVNPAGTLTPLNDGSFNLVLSWNVMEHVNRRILRDLLRDIVRVLKPGGCSLHKIDLTDHLAHFDRSMSLKNYLRYSDKTWRRFFENRVQYLNRVQRPEWSRLLYETGLDLVAEELVTEDIGEVPIDPRYAPLSDADRRCLAIFAVHRKLVCQHAAGGRGSDGRRAMLKA